MTVLDGFFFWIGKTIAEAAVVAVVVLLFVAVAMLIISLPTKKRK